MAQNPRTSSQRIAEFSADARSDLAENYDNTAEFWGDKQADIYSDFLLDCAQKLADTPSIAPLVPNFTGVRVYIARWNNARQGHRIFFEETDTGILVLRIRHTAMNWPDNLKGR